MSVAVEPKTKADSAKLGPHSLACARTDSTLHLASRAFHAQTILEGMGDSHLDVAIRRAGHNWRRDSHQHTQGAYRETITREGAAQYRHKKQTAARANSPKSTWRFRPTCATRAMNFLGMCFVARSVLLP